MGRAMRRHAERRMLHVALVRHSRDRQKGQRTPLSSVRPGRQSRYNMQLVAGRFDCGRGVIYPVIKYFW
jgi:hypothetical protein